MISTPSNNIRSIVYPAAAVGIATAAIWFLGGHTFCWVKGLIGIPCPGCGLTRAYLSLLHCDVPAAFRFHPLFPVIPFIAVVILLRKKKFFSKIHRSWLFWNGMLAVFLLLYVFRMFLFFPSAEPMTFNHASLLCHAASLIKSGLQLF